MKHSVDESDTQGRVHLDDVRAFCAVAAASSITGAAATLGEDKGAVSRRLRRLEAALGQQLVRRGARAASLTEEGTIYFEVARRAMTLLDDGRDALRERHGAIEGSVRVTAPGDLAATVLAPAVDGFLAKHPRVAIDVVVSDSLLDFEAHDIDLALRAVPSLSDTDLVAQELSLVQGGLFAAPSYLDAHGTPTAPAELASHALLLRRPSGRRASRITLEAHGKTRRIDVTPRVASSDFAFLRAATLAGVGIAELPDLVVAEDVRLGALRRVLPQHRAFTARLYLLSRKSRVLPRRVRALRDFLAACDHPVPSRARGVAEGGEPG